MAVTMITAEGAATRYVGLSTDTKPTADVLNGAEFLEVDTLDRFIFTAAGSGSAAQWNPVGSAIQADDYERVAVVDADAQAMQSVLLRGILNEIRELRKTVCDRLGAPFLDPSDVKEG